MVIGQTVQPAGFTIADRVKYNTIGLGTLLLIGLKSSAAQHWSDTLEPQQL